METRTQYDMYIPTRTIFGAGSLNTLHQQALPGKKALIVISSGRSTRANGYLDRTEEQLHKAGVETVVFDKVEANPLKSTVMAGGKMARENGCDFIVALGGGSCIDASKAIAVMAVNPGDYWDYVCAGTGKGKPFVHTPLPTVAISTTAGTGSETDASCVITNPETHEKIGQGNPALFPRLAIVDPELMLTVPPKFTAYQGFDALFHSTEAYISNFANLMSDMYAINAIESVGRNLAAAVKDGNNLAARERVAWANSLSGTVMCVGRCTSSHSMEHAMSAHHQDLPHGAGLIIISLAYYSFFIRRHACDERFVRMARAMGREDATRPEEFVEVLAKLQEDCGVAGLKMSDYGITPDELPEFARNARSTMGRLFAFDRVPLSEEDVTSIYREAYK